MPLQEGQSPSNYLYLIEMDGLRFLHMGDIGQDSLTEEQLKIIGDIDVLMTQTENGFSKMTFKNKKGFNLIEQINPHLILLTHSGQKSYKYAKENWTLLASKDKNIISLNPEKIRKMNKTVIIMGSTNLAYKKLLEAKIF
jgi:L-ascorbate metabolism protein UlaG (beta-lactamase superfamily)